MSPEWHECMAIVFFQTIECMADGYSDNFCQDKFNPSWKMIKSYQNEPIGKFRCPGPQIAGK